MAEDATILINGPSVRNEELNESEVMIQRLNLFNQRTTTDQLREIATAPLFTNPVLKYAKGLKTSESPQPLPQYGLLAGNVESLHEYSFEDSQIFYNVATPSSVFICGSQGSGKSHTLSCILENCLIQSKKLGYLPRPLTGIVFHYGGYASDSCVTPCEAAYLGSDPSIRVRVLCSPINVSVIKDSYSGFENVTVEALRLDLADLNTTRMMELMAFDQAPPLYAQVVMRILRDMRLEKQGKSGGFSYSQFMSKIREVNPSCYGLNERLSTLENFMVPAQVNPLVRYDGSQSSTDWTPKAGELLIIDLSCPCVTASMACALFNLCLSIFLAQDSSLGRIVALDDAHRYMGGTPECEALTNNLLSAIRFRRHLGARIVISAQEPTISPKLLDLCSITIVHRFSSPEWLNVLTKRLAGFSKLSEFINQFERWTRFYDKEEPDWRGLRGIGVSENDPILDLFSQIMELPTGEALVFAPDAITWLEKQDGKLVPRKLAHRVLRVVMRARITADGGKSIMAS
ncbi:hypothetical protein F5Y09DRAFT_355490 [Xylaria sp. FL1042]|nr:hypothetical protein F5Y09DRAFT_355490 [Xylaria sp. FL1042]